MRELKLGSRVFQLATTLIGMAVSGLAYALDPGAIESQQLLRQQEQERALRERQESRPDIHVDPVDKTMPALVKLDAKLLPHDETPCFPIKEIHLIGEEAQHFQWVLAQAHLHNGLADSAIGQCLGAQGINIVAARLQHAIIDRGFVTTRVLASQQTLDNGILTLTLIPGRIHTIRFAEGTSQRATKWNALPMKRGDLLNLRDIEQALENFKRVPTAVVDIQIGVAQATDAALGDSDLIIRWGFVA